MTADDSSTGSMTMITPPTPWAGPPKYSAPPRASCARDRRGSSHQPLLSAGRHRRYSCYQLPIAARARELVDHSTPVEAPYPSSSSKTKSKKYSGSTPSTAARLTATACLLPQSSSAPVGEDRPAGHAVRCKGCQDGQVDVRKRNRVRVTGRAGGPVVMLAHGFGCDQTLWRLVAPALEDRFQVVLFDHVGAGRSDASAWSPERYSTLDGYVQDVIGLCRELGLGPVTFVGHSVSSMIGVLAAVQEPALFEKLILLTPSPSYIDDGNYRGDSAGRTSMNCSSRWTAIIWAGRRPWHR